MFNVTKSLEISFALLLKLIPGTGYLLLLKVNSIGNDDILPNALVSKLEKAPRSCLVSPHAQ